MLYNGSIIASSNLRMIHTNPRSTAPGTSPSLLHHLLRHTPLWPPALRYHSLPHSATASCV